LSGGVAAVGGGSGGDGASRRRHLVLVGMMGSGKTSIGRRVAKALGHPFVDADDGYIARFGETVAQTFAGPGGEPLFRDRETELLRALIGVNEPLVIASGGGVVTSAVNRQLLRDDRVHCVYLASDIEFLVTKVELRAHRPLLAVQAPGVALRSLWEEREGWYAEVADDTVEVDRLLAAGWSKAAIARHIADRWSERPD
jgi:shikimate kinase